VVISWTAAYISPWSYLFMILLFFFILLDRCFLLYISYVLRAPYTFDDISITY
jgi:hypothetical protein